MKPYLSKSSDLTKSLCFGKYQLECKITSLPLGLMCLSKQIEVKYQNKQTQNLVS